MLPRTRSRPPTPTILLALTATYSIHLTSLHGTGPQVVADAATPHRKAPISTPAPRPTSAQAPTTALTLLPRSLTPSGRGVALVIACRGPPATTTTTTRALLEQTVLATAVPATADSTTLLALALAPAHADVQATPSGTTIVQTNVDTRILTAGALPFTVAIIALTHLPTVATIAIARSLTVWAQPHPPPPQTATTHIFRMTSHHLPVDNLFVHLFFAASGEVSMLTLLISSLPLQVSTLTAADTPGDPGVHLQQGAAVTPVNPKYHSPRSPTSTLGSERGPATSSRSLTTTLQRRSR